MSVDFQVVYPVDLIPLASVSELPPDTAGLRRIQILGTDFRTVDEVLINNQKSTSLALLNRMTLTAVVPSSVGKAAVTAVSVFSNRLTLSARSQIRFKLGEVTGRVSGMLRLMQFFLKLLFTSPRRDIFDPQLGGDALANIGHTFGAKQGASVVNDFVIAVDRTARQIISLQARDHRIPREERLLIAKVESANFSRGEAALVTTTSLTNQAGKIGIANVEL